MKAISENLLSSQPQRDTTSSQLHASFEVSMTRHREAHFGGVFNYRCVIVQQTAIITPPTGPSPTDPRPSQPLFQLLHPPRNPLPILLHPKPIPHPLQIPLMLRASIILPTRLLATPLAIWHVSLEIIVVVPVKWEFIRRQAFAG